MTPLTRRLSHFEEPVYGVLRLLSGLMFSLHGMQKLLGWFGSKGMPEVGSQMWFGGVIELVAGVLIAIGLFTRPAAFLASGTMAVAYFQFHWKLELAGDMWAPIVNRGELAAVYCFLFLFFCVRGAGPYSLDAKLRHAS
jgi:putative oxidoreductase